MLKFSDFITQEQVLAEKDLSAGRFIIEDENNTVTFKYFKGNDMNSMKISVSEDENVSVMLKVNNKEVIMNDLPRTKFIMKMREFLQKIK